MEKPPREEEDSNHHLAFVLRVQEDVCGNSVKDGDIFPLKPDVHILMISFVPPHIMDPLLSGAPRCNPLSGVH